MEPQMDNQLPETKKLSPLHQVTPLSKYLAMILFIIMPFLGGWIGYKYVPEKIVEISLPILENDNIQNFESVESPTTTTDNDGSVSSELSTGEPYTYSEPYFGLPLFPKFVVEKPFPVIDPYLNSPDNPKYINNELEKGVMVGDYSWGSGPPVIYVKQTTISVITDPDCEYGCAPENIARLDYYTYDNNSDLILFYTEEMDVSRIRSAEYIILGYDYGQKFTFIQSINKRYCCDDGGEIINRVFDVSVKDSKTIVRENIDV